MLSCSSLCISQMYQCVASKLYFGDDLFPMVRIESCAISSMSYDSRTYALQHVTNHQLNIQPSNSIPKQKFQQKDSDKSYFGTCSRD